MDGFVACPCGSGERYRFCCRPGDRARQEAGRLAWRHGLDSHQELLLRAYGSPVSGAAGDPHRERLRATHSPRLHPEWVELDGPDPAPKPFVHEGRPWGPADFDLRLMGGESIEARRASVAAALAALTDRFRGHLHHRFHVGLREARRHAFWAASYATEFLLPCWNVSPIHVRPWEEPVRTFLGNYVIRRYEACGIDDLIAGLHALSAYYAFLHRLGLAPRFIVEPAIDACRDWAFYERRLSDYLALRDGGTNAWIDWTVQFDYEHVPPPPHPQIESDYETRMREYHRAG